MAAFTMRVAARHDTRARGVSARRSLAVLMISCLMIMGGGAAHAADGEGALAFIRSTSESIQAKLDAYWSNGVEDPDQRELRALLDREFSTRFDYELISRLALGKHWKQSGPEERAIVSESLRRRLVAVYVAALADGEQFEIGYLGARPSRKGNRALVLTEILRSGKAPIPMSYRVRQRDGAWKVYDIVVEGVSMLKTTRNEFGGLISRDGLSGLAKLLREEHAKP